MKAVIDSCVIFGMPLYDTLLRAAEANLYQIVLSPEQENLVAAIWSSIDRFTD
jgi:hypothetical protein